MCSASGFVSVHEAFLFDAVGDRHHPETVIPKVSQGPLAAMIGTTRSLRSFFLNKFRKLDSIDYPSKLLVRRFLRTVLLHDE
jgi:hypothetical protein